MSTENAHKELTPQEMKEKLEELQEENKLLHTQDKLLHEELDKYYQRFQRYQAEDAARGKPDEKVAEKIRDLEARAARLKAKEDALRKFVSKAQEFSTMVASGRSRPSLLKLIKAGGYINRPTASLGGG